LKTAQHLSADTVASLPEQLLTTAEVATWLGIQRCTLEKARSTRLGDFPPYVRIGRAIRYRRSAVDVWLNGHAFNVDGSPALPTIINTN